MPDRLKVYQDQALTNLSVKYSNPDDLFVADKLFPIVEVAKESGKYYVYDKSNLRREDSRQQGTGRAKRISYQVTPTDYGPLTKHQLEADIPHDLIQQQDAALDARIDATAAVSEKLLIGKELDLFSASGGLADTAVVTQNTTLSGTSQWSDYSNSNPFQNITTAINALRKNGIVAPNTITFSEPVWEQLVNHPDFVDRVKYNALGAVNADNVKALFPGIQNVIVAGAVYNTADEGAADSLDFIAGKHAWLSYVNPRPALRALSAGYTLTLQGARKVERWDEPWQNAEFVRVQDQYQQKLVAAEAIYLIKNAVA